VERLRLASLVKGCPARGVVVPLLKRLLPGGFDPKTTVRTIPIEMKKMTMHQTARILKAKINSQLINLHLKNKRPILSSYFNLPAPVISGQKMDQAETEFCCDYWDGITIHADFV
jgi:hypothetical protein